MNHYLELIYLFIPVILAGIFNMVFVKIRFLNVLKKPMDNGTILHDGQRLFGDNKTWKGFIGMVVFTAFFMVLQKYFSLFFLPENYLQIVDFNSINGVLVGSVLGLGYALFELPNSFIKRRINIQPGKNISGFAGLFFTILDQADSVIGCICAMLFFYSFSLFDFVFMIFFGSALHYALNVLLYLAKLKKQAA